METEKEAKIITLIQAILNKYALRENVEFTHTQEQWNEYYQNNVPLPKFDNEIEDYDGFDTFDIFKIAYEAGLVTLARELSAIIKKTEQYGDSESEV